MKIPRIKTAKGVTRFVVIFQEEFVIKFPRINSWKHFLSGLLANSQERLFSKSGWPELCPVNISCPLGFWLVMRYARPMTEEEWLEFDYDAFVHHSGPYVIPVEEKRGSFGWAGDRVVAIDYGN